ncbi:MAG TPA: Ig-like domain-containing protein [Verrucomicrobiales bacterium]|nr:Ig-like domain-containing protein [Verrucomicrobiales bacterium]
MDSLTHLRQAFLLPALMLLIAGGMSSAQAVVTVDQGFFDDLDVELQPLTSTTEDVEDGFSNNADSFAAESNDVTVVTVSVLGSVVTINALKVGTATVTVTGTDLTDNASAQGTFLVTVYNTAPVFITLQDAMPDLKNGGQNMTEDEILEIGVNFGGGVDANLLGPLNIDDDDEPDSTLGIAITGYTGNGTWQYRNALNAWVNLPSLSGTTVFLLRSTDRIRYDGDDENGETATLTFRLWDGTQGSALTTFNAVTTGGSTAFSGASRVSDVPVDAVQDPAEFNNVTSPVSGDDDAGLLAFAGVTVDDVDRNPADELTVTVTVSDITQGTLNQGGSPPLLPFEETGIGTGVYTLSGPEDDVEDSLQALVFQPVANIAPVGDVTTTTLSLAVSDGEEPPNGNPDGADDTAAVTVNITSVNDPPLIIPGLLEQFLFTRGSLLPFAGFTIFDPDIAASGGGQTMTVTVTEMFTTANGSFILADGTTADDTVTFTDVSIEEAIAQLEGLRYLASSLDLAVPEVVTLLLEVEDVEEDSDSEEVEITVATPSITGNIRGTVSGQIIPDNSARRLFEGVAITGSDVASLEVTAFVVTPGEFASQNVLTAGLGTFIEVGDPPLRFSPLADKLVFVGAASDATNAVRRLAFQPVPNMVTTQETIQVSLTLKNSDGDSLGADNRTTAHIVAVNDLPTFIKFQALGSITDNETVKPFASVEIGDVDEQGMQELGISIEMLSSLPPGTASTPVPGMLEGPETPGFTVDGLNAAKYVFSGTPAEATAAIQGLTFTPGSNRLPPGQNETVIFRVVLDDDSGDVVVREQVRIVIISENDDPVVTNAPSGRRMVVAGSGILPFGMDFTLDDVDLNDQITIRIQLDDASKGFLVDSTGRISESPPGSGIYVGTAGAVDMEAALQGLEFALDPGYPVPAGEPGIEVFFTSTLTDRLGGRIDMSFSLLVRVEQVVRVVVNLDDSGPGSLRQAISDAQGNDHVAFDLAHIYAVESLAIIRLQSPLVIDKNLTITGPGAEKLFLSGDSDEDGAPDVQIFQVGVAASDSSPSIASYLHLSYISLIHGSDAESDFGNGGAISVGPGSTLVVDHIEALECFAEQWGGAIDVEGGRLTASHSLFAFNRTGVNLGEGGGAISLHTSQRCDLFNVTFSQNVQGSENGVGGGALYVENANVESMSFDVNVTHCTFFENVDEAHLGSAIRTNVFNTRLNLRNCLLADGDPNPLDPNGAGRIISLGGNVADDDTRVTLSQGGVPQTLILLDQPSDRRSQVLPLLPLADNGGQTRTHGLPAGSPALGAGLASGIATDQRDVWRDAAPDAGAYEANTFKRIVINEIQFDPPAGAAQYIEVVNPRDSETLNLGGYEVWVQGVLRHVFSPVNLVPGAGILVAQDTGLPVMPSPPGSVPVQDASVSGNLDLGENGGIVEIRTAGPMGALVATATYLASFEESGDPGVELREAEESVTRNCEFLGAFLPGTATPGEDEMNVPLAEGNAPPIAFDDEVETDEDSPLEVDVLANDFDADRTDVIRVEFLPAAQSSLGAALSIVHTPMAGAAVSYNPTVSATIQALPAGTMAVDTFDYIILDYANGTTPNLPRGANAAEIAANLERATGTVSVHLTGVNDAPTPQDDKPAAIPALATFEDTALTFAADTLLLNDTDPDTGESGLALRICWVKPFGFVLEDKDPTRVELSDLETISELGAHVQLILRADRTESTLTYDPRGSAVLDALAAGEIVEDRFSYLVIDPHGAPGIATVCIKVTGRNDPPVARDDGPFATDEDHALSIARAAVLANDTDVDQNGNPPDDVLTVASVGLSSNLGAAVSLTPAGGPIIYNPTGSLALQMLSKKEIVEDHFEYTISDGNGGNASAMVFVRVAGVNDAPVAFDDVAMVEEDFDVSISVGDGVLANDVDIDMDGNAPDDVLRAIPAATFETLLGAMVTLYSDGSFDYLPGGLFEWLGQGETATDEFEYTATDDGLLFANGDAFQVIAGSIDVFLPVLLNDVNLGIDPSLSLKVTQAGIPNRGGTALVSPEGEGILYSPAFGFVGVETFTYEIADGPNGFCMAEVQVEVIPAFGPLAAKEDRFQVAPGGTADLDLLANDLFLPGGASIALTSLSPADQGGTVNIILLGGRTVARYTPAPGFTGVEQFSYLATAGGGTSFGADVHVTVPDRMGSLRAWNDHFFVVGGTEGNALPVLANDGVLPATAASWTLAAGGLAAPSGGGTVSVSADGRSVLYTPAAGFFGTETFTYLAQDAFGGTGMALVSVMVVEDGFLAANDVFGVNWESAGNILPVLANDVLIPDDGEVIEITFVENPVGGTAVWNASRSALIYTPDPGFSGQDTFSYEIGAATHPRQAASVTVNVLDRSGELRGGDDFYCVAGDSVRNALRVLANDRLLPINGPPLVVTGFTNPTEGGVLEVAPDGAFLFYTPMEGFIGTETFTYQFSDGRGGTGSATATVKAGSIFVGDDIFTVVSNSDDNFLDVLANDRRIPGGVPPELAGVSGGPSGNGMVALNLDEDAFLYTPEGGFTGVETFTYQVEDDTGGVYEAAVMVRVVAANSDHAGAKVVLTVKGANDAPTLTGVQAIDFHRDDEIAKPFATVVIGEVDSNGLQPLTVTVEIDDPAKGELTDLDGFVEGPPGTYTFFGTAADATTAIQGLCFVPTEDRIEWSKHETTTFTICVDDGIAPPVCSSGTTIEVYNIGHLFGDNWIFGNGVTLSWDERRNLTVGGGQPFGFPLGGGGTWSDWYTGEWLVYSDGRTAWNAQTGMILTGADGTLGAGNGENNSIPAIIVPKPGGNPRENLYIFTTGGNEQRVHFTEIDLSVGLHGAVVDPPGVLVAGSTSSKEGWVLVPHANGADYWLIIGTGDVYPITSAGVGAPVSNFNLDGKGGSFRYSLGGRRLAVAWSPPRMNIYDFNPATGVVSSTSSIELSHGSSFFEFSHDGTKLYVNDMDTVALYQYDLSADPGPASPTAARTSAVAGTQVLLHTYAAPDYVGDMALGPDGMMYLAGDSSNPPKLHRIGFPNALGAASQLQLDAVVLPAGSQIRQGLYHGLRTDDMIPEGPPVPQNIFETGVLADVSSAAGWMTVTLDRSYDSMVVIATPQYSNTQVPVVPRIQNAMGNSFQIRLARLDNVASPPIVVAPVHYVVVEEGVYSAAVDGIKMEAVRYTSTLTDRKSSWNGQNRSYQQPYSNPVVLGQVQTSNDARFSVFWARGSNSGNPPSSTQLWTGKHVAEDPVTARVDETVGYIVIEAGTGNVGEYDYSAFVGADTIVGMENTPPIQYAVSGIADPVAAVASSAAMDVNDGGWPVLYGTTPLTTTSIALAIDEDRLSDNERSHATEQVAVLVLGNSASGGSGNPLIINAAAASLLDWQQEHFDSEELSEPTLGPILWGLMADADGDGRKNVEEYAFGLDPRRREESEPLRVWVEPSSTGERMELRVSYRRRAQDQLLRYTLEQSTDLGTWRAAPSWVVNTIPAAGTGYDRVILGAGLPEGQQVRFYRIRVTR